MKGIDLLQIGFYFLVVLALVKPLGWYIAQVYEGKPCGLNQVLGFLERFIYKLCRIQPDEEMNWMHYLSSTLSLSLISLLFLYLILRFQFYLPLNPQSFSGMPPDLAFNTAVSFVTNTNWQSYGGENTLSYFSQMIGLTVQNFVSAAVGMSLLMAVIRGFSRHEQNTLGNFWVDTVRGILYILLPLSLLLAPVLSSQGVIQNFKAYEKVQALQANNTQTLPMGPVASQIAIKQLGTNGGGFFNANSAHPFENPTPISSFLEMLAILIIPASLCYSFGLLINDRRQGWAILFAMFMTLLPLVGFIHYEEQQGNPAFMALDIDQQEQGNMEGKEIRFGVPQSASWAALTTATANGSVNAMLDSFIPLSGLVPLWLMHLGEVVFGGVGTGLSSMLILIIITVFVAGLMVGRTPEYLGKKIEPYEMKMASIAVLVMPLFVLLFTAFACVTLMGVGSIANPGAHGFTEILYAFTSMVNNNGSAFAGLNANTYFYNFAGGIAMLIGRFWIAIPTLAIAGSLAKKKKVPVGLGTLSTHTPLFIVLLVGITTILGALSFLPSLALGPIAEQLMLWSQYGQ